MEYSRSREPPVSQSEHMCPGEPAFLQFLACILKAVIPAAIVPRAYLEREWDTIIRICCLGDLPVPGSRFNARAPAIVVISVTAEVFRHGGAPCYGRVNTRRDLFELLNCLAARLVAWHC
jgi:hypothetical protein